MENQIIEDKVFKGTNYLEEPLLKIEYENCSFINCQFINADLSNITFIDCLFDKCDLSMANIKSTAFRDVRFLNSKMVGLNFEECNSFLISFSFEECVLSLASFFKLKIKDTQFKNCNLQEVDFTETTLSNSVFDNCDLTRAIFARTNLEKVDFRTSYNYSIDPEVNRINNAKFSRIGVLGLLDRYNIDIE
ncbi:pentapeptide repeat-containing protein [uncultured Bacteroides sp.]|uniref:pentapeptide repeat-containing protein n=1 Tax=uncultured Bacteroides sp. TaxID=162156 RepID=UPI002AABAE13|nr:pentapeptide repeat-containing protein [uncultured Bacteroides sp.]